MYAGGRLRSRLWDGSLPPAYIAHCIFQQYCKFYFVVWSEQQTWLSMLTTKFKFERNKLTDDAAVQAQRAKFGGKRPRQSVVSVSDATSADRCKRFDVSLL